MEKTIGTHTLKELSQKFQSVKALGDSFSNQIRMDNIRMHLNILQNLDTLENTIEYSRFSMR